MLSLLELRRVVRVLEPRLLGHRLQAVVQPSATAVALTTFGGDPAAGSERRRHWLLSGRPETARISQLARLPAAMPSPPALAQYLRAHGIGARIEAISLLGGDRQLAIRLRGPDAAFDLLLAIFGRRANVFVLDAAGRLVAALRPLARTRPELAFGDPWKPPESSPPREGEDRFADVSDDDLLRAIEAEYSERERSDERETLVRRIGSALRKESKTRARKLEKLSRELDEAREATALERQGELLKGVLSQVKRGDREVIARDHERGEDVVISLDPTLSASENLQQLFKRYQKAIRRITKAGARQDTVLAGSDEMEASTREFESVVEKGDLAELRAFAQRPDIQKLLARFAPEPSDRVSGRGPRSERKLGKHSLPARLMPRRYATADGLEIWVGRNDAGNDHLSTRLARGKDLFFHLDGAPGSHVVLRTGGRTDPPSDAVLDACELAVHFSKFKNAGRADVHVVPIKNVKKPKGAKPGLVMVHGGKTIHLRRIPRRLDRVLNARIED